MQNIKSIQILIIVIHKNNRKRSLFRFIYYIYTLTPLFKVSEFIKETLIIEFLINQEHDIISQIV